MGTIAKLLGSLIGGFIITLWRACFPPETASDVQENVLKQDLNVMKAEQESAVSSPTKMEELIKEQMEGKAP